MSVILNIYTTLNEQGILSKAVAYLKANPMNTCSAKGTSGSANSVTNQDLKGMSTWQIASLITSLLAVSPPIYDYVNICVPTQTSTATNKLTYDQVAALDAILKTTKQGTVNNIVRAGTAASNSTQTNIVLDSGASAVDDYYKGMYIVTAGVTAVTRMITGYTGTTKIATVVATGTAITTTETFTIYTSPNMKVIGDASSSLTACYEAWLTLFPGKNIPALISLMGGTGSNIQPHYLVTQTATSAAAASLTHTSNFTNKMFNSGNYYVAIESATTGAGQVKRIISNTASVLTIEPWDIIPTGAIVYQVGTEFMLYEKYLPYAILSYLVQDTAKTNMAFQNLLDKDNIMPGGGYKPLTNMTTLKHYADLGKAIFDAKVLAVVT